MRHPKAPWFVQQGLLAGVQTFEELEANLRQLPTEQKKGDAFDVFAEAYFVTQPIQQAAEGTVRPWQSVPQAIKDRLHSVSQDTGVDGVFQTVAGDLTTLHAYQVKFRSDGAPISWSELATFLSRAEPGKVAHRILFTNSNRLSSMVGEWPSHFHAIFRSDLCRLTPEDFAVMRALFNGDRVKLTPRTARPYQDEALAAILPALKENGSRATAVMACATGKTLVAFWAAQRLQAQRTLVLLPSLALMRQTLHEWLQEGSIRYLCVCSDRTVAKGLDALEVRPGDLDFPVTTDPEVVQRFLDKPTTEPLVVFSTYQSAHVVAQGMPKGYRFDLGIFDEAHKTAGRENAQFGFALKDRHLRISRRLFMTATRRHYDVRRRNRQGDRMQVFSMDQPKVYGPVVHTLSFTAAAQRGLIVPFKVLISIVTESDLANRIRGSDIAVDSQIVKARQVANQIALVHAAGRYGISLLFVYTPVDVSSQQEQQPRQALGQALEGILGGLTGATDYATGRKPSCTSWTGYGVGC